MNRKTIFSPCRLYRYTLWRWWDLPTGLPYGRMGESGFEQLPLKSRSAFVQFIGLNPSTADEVQDDPTIRRCISFAKAWGYGALCMTNIFAFRATDPNVMKSQDDPIGPENNLWLKEIRDASDLTIAAWGTHGSHMGREIEIVKLLPNLRCLSVNANGSPKHPLYIRGDTKPVEFRPLK